MLCAKSCALSSITPNPQRRPQEVPQGAPSAGVGIGDRVAAGRGPTRRGAVRVSTWWYRPATARVRSSPSIGLARTGQIDRGLRSLATRWFGWLGGDGRPGPHPPFLLVRDGYRGTAQRDGSTGLCFVFRFYGLDECHVLGNERTREGMIGWSRWFSGLLFCSRMSRVFSIFQTTIQ